MKRPKPNRIFLSIFTFIAFAVFLSINSVQAQEPTNEELLTRIEALEAELQYFRDLLQTNIQKTNEAEERAVAAEAMAVEATRVAENTAEAASGEPPLPDTLWHLSGYADAGARFVSSNLGNDSFAIGHFNPAFHFQYRDLVLFEGELEFEIEDDGATEVKLEYAAINFLVHNNATLVIGKFLSPVGQFQERLHPSWINKIGDAPAGFVHDGAQPEADVGIQVRGGVDVGSRSTFTYALALGNGPRLGHEGAAAFEGFGGDDNQNKSFSGRLGFLPVPYLEFGVSYLTGKIKGQEGPGHDEGHTEAITIMNELEPTSATVKIWGVDAAYTRGPWDFRFEYLNSVRGAINSFSEEEEEIVMFPKLTMKAWYVQLAYRLSEITDSRILQKFEPVVRYGRFNITGSEELFEENAQKRLNFGLNYWIAPSIVGRIGYERRKFLYDGRLEKILMLQAAYGF